MKLKNILTETLLDTLPMKKIDKLILNLFHNNPQKLKSKDIMDISTKYAVSIDLVLSLYETYKKYSGLLFSEEGITKVENYDTTLPEYSEIYKTLIFEYIEKHYLNKTIIESNGINGTVEFVEDVNAMIEEEMGPEVWITKQLTGEYEGTVTWGDNKGKKYKTDDVGINVVLYLQVTPNDKGYGFDMMNHNHEAMGDWMINHEGMKYTDIIASGHVKVGFLKPLQNFKEEEVKRFVDQWINVSKKIIGRNMSLMEKYEDFIEHGETMFEGYNKKRK